MDAPNTDFTLAGCLEDLKATGQLVVHGVHRPILVVYDRGSVEDGILTCHWRHARFDLDSGCTSDLWADDAPTIPIQRRNGDVWVKTTFGHADPECTGASGSMTGSRTTSALSSPKRC